MGRPFNVAAVEEKWQARWAEDGTYEVDNDDPRERFYALCMYPYPVGLGPPGPRAQLHLRRPGRALPDNARQGGTVALRLRLLRPRRPRTPPSRPGATRASITEARMEELKSSVLPSGRRLRLAPRGVQPRPRVHAVLPDDLPGVLRSRPGLPGGGAGQLVPRLRHGAGQRAGPGRRHLRAIRRPRRAPELRTVVLQDHRLRRGAA